MKLNCMMLLVTAVVCGLAGNARPAGGSARYPGEDGMSAYLMAYFSDDDHGLHFALSDDGYSFTALNGNRPVISGDSIADQRGIRDPHIYRGPDGAFYMALTDLHIYAQREGLRDSLWERPSEYGWGNNRGLVLMKSADLINWSHNRVRLDSLFPEDYGEIGCVWAPQTIYDADAGKMMVYFTIRVRGEKLPGGNPADKKTRLFFAYADDEFTTLVTKPRLLFDHPDAARPVLDADICPMPDGRFFMTYCSQENPAGIKAAVSDSINSGYSYSAEWLDFEPRSCEAPTIWKRIGEEKWVLMYDIFSIKPHNFGFAETTDFKTFTNLGHFNEGPMKTTNFVTPKHGAVIYITADEARRLRDRWP